jgi:hypothetical protein
MRPAHPYSSEAILASDDHRAWLADCAGLAPEEVSIRLGLGKRLVGRLLDESRDGIRVRLGQGAGLQADDRVEAYYSGVKCSALVKRVEPAADGGLLIDFEFVKSHGQRFYTIHGSHDPVRLRLKQQRVSSRSAASIAAARRSEPAA